MKTILLRSLAMAFSCFSKIPMPQFAWELNSMRYMMAFFPLVGVVISLFVALWLWICSMLGLSSLLRAVGLTLVPLFVSGGVHLDGFADTADALSSHAEPQIRRAILKDPHVGAFAIISVMTYIIAYLGMADELDAQGRAFWLLMCVPVVSRALSGIATVSFKLSSDDGMLSMEHKSSSGAGVFCVLVATVALVAGVMFGIQPIVGGITAVSALVSLLATRSIAQRQFGGMSGDLAGFFLQIAEFAMLTCIVIVGKMV